MQQQLDVLKALGDNTRYALYLELLRAGRPLSTAEIAEALRLHPNTVRPHLERMRIEGAAMRRGAIEGDMEGAKLVRSIVRRHATFAHRHKTNTAI